MYELGIATQSLKPAHEYTPWVTIDGEHSFDEGTGGLETFLCSGLLKDAPECKQRTQIMRSAPAKMCYREDAPTTSTLIEVYYEALCGGCMDFITTELHPTYMQFKRYLSVQFYPYGNTMTSENLDPYGKHQSLFCLKLYISSINVAGSLYLIYFQKVCMYLPANMESKNVSITYSKLVCSTK